MNIISTEKEHEHINQKSTKPIHEIRRINMIMKKIPDVLPDELFGMVSKSLENMPHSITYMFLKI